MKVFFIAVLSLLAVTSVCSQTLFSYGPYKVSKEEFLRAYQKNKSATGADEQSIKEYLELYTRFRLKVQAALDLKLDTLPNQQADLLNYRRQIETGYLIDSSAFRKMVNVAYERSKKDIRLSHILIPLEPAFKDFQIPIGSATKEDSLAALKKTRDLESRLRAGESFEKLALEYSGDSTVKYNRGDLGYITLFSLPYKLENVAYGLKLNEISAPVLSSAGYHLFKKTGERPARGKVRVAQILLAVDPQASIAEKQNRLSLADSIYTALKSGASFPEMAGSFSDDKNSFATGGNLPEFGVGQYDPEFEEHAFRLSEPGAISQPFETSFGIHILKLLEKIPVETDPEKAGILLKGMVSEDKRSQLARLLFEEDVLRKMSAKKSVFTEKSLRIITDSFILNDKVLKRDGISPEMPLISFKGKTVTVMDWLRYARTAASKSPDGSLDYSVSMPAFIRSSTIDYYRDHLEEYNPDFKTQLEEFRNGNLLFEIMEKKIWNPAANDEAELKKYFNDHRSRYQWAPSAGAVIVNAADKQLAEEARHFLQNNPSAWRSLMENSQGKILTDSGRFELNQLGQSLSSGIKAGSVTPFINSENDPSVTFAYITNVYPNTEGRNFEEAKGMVINDYQQVLEEKWVARLKKQYPVKINQAVWAKVKSGK